MNVRERTHNDIVKEVSAKVLKRNNNIERFGRIGRYASKSIRKLCTRRSAVRKTPLLVGVIHVRIALKVPSITKAEAAGADKW